MKSFQWHSKLVVGLVMIGLIFNLSIVRPAKAAEPSAKPKAIKLTIGCDKPLEGGKAFSIVRDIFVAEVSKRVAEGTKYKIDWVIAFGGTVAKDGEVLEATEMGLLDIGYVIYLFSPAKLFLHNFGYWIPFSSSDIVSVNKINRKLFDDFPELGKVFEEKYNQKFLSVVTTQSYQLITTFPVKTLSDLKGKKIAAGGINLAVLPPIGAIPVQSAIGEAYTSLQAGVYHGWLNLDSIMAALKWPQVAPYVTIVDLGSTAGVALTINLKTWNGLPVEVREIIQEAAITLSEKGVKELVQDVAMSRERLKKMGAHVSTLDPQERKRWVETLPNLPNKMAKEADAKGLPGSKLIRKYIEMQKEAGYVFPREWQID